MNCTDIAPYLPRQLTELLRVMSGADEAFVLKLAIIDTTDDAVRCLVMGCALNAALHKRGAPDVLPIGDAIIRLNASLGTEAQINRTKDDKAACSGDPVLFARLLRRLYSHQIGIPSEDLEGLFGGEEDSRAAYFERAFEHA